MRSNSILVKKKIYERYAFFSVCEGFETYQYIVFYKPMIDVLRKAQLGAPLEVIDITHTSRSCRFKCTICTKFKYKGKAYNDDANDNYWETMFEDYGDEFMGWI